MKIDDLTYRMSLREIRAARIGSARIGFFRYAVLFEGATRSVALVARGLGHRHARVRAARRAARIGAAA